MTTRRSGFIRNISTITAIPAKIRQYIRYGIAATLLTSALTGCAVEPWVKPYERANLADPIMSFERDPVSGSYINHVYQARESARGAEGGQGGGCGCN